MIGDVMELFQVDDGGQLFISPAISDWRIVQAHSIDTIIDLEGGLDLGVPTVPNQYLYIYFPIFDDDLPNLSKLHAVAVLGAKLVRDGHFVHDTCSTEIYTTALVA